MAYNWLMMTSSGDDNWSSGSLGLLTDKTKKNKTFNKRKNRALLTVKIGNNRDCVIQCWLSAWAVRDFISHSLHSVVA